MSKATHNGTCQVCGAQQAVSNKYGTLAKHGYTTKWGFFSGTCAGSDHKPLEVSRALADESIKNFNDHAEALESITLEDIKEVPVTFGSAYKGTERTEMMGEEAWNEQSKTHRMGGYYNFKDAAKAVFNNKQFQARNLRAHITFLTDLIEKRHGQDLISREPEKQVERIKERFDDYRTAGVRAEELKAEGWKVRITRCKYTGERTLSATRAA